MKNIVLEGLAELSLERKGSILSWSDNSNYYYLMEELDISRFLPKREELEDKQNSFQAMFLQLLAGCAKKHDFFYSVLFGCKLYRRKNLAFSTLVSFDQEIAGSVRIENPHLKDFDSLRQELRRGRSKLSKTAAVPWWLNYMPMFFLHWVMSGTIFLMYRLNYWASWLPLDRDVFGGVVVSNVGSFGSSAWIVPQQNRYYAPLCSIVYGRAENNKLKVTFGFDHRIADGRHSMAFINDVKIALQGLV